MKNDKALSRELIRMQDELFDFAFKLTANKEDAYDLVQETSLKALDNFENYTPETNFKGWIYTILRNIFIKSYRHIVRSQGLLHETEKYFSLPTNINTNNSDCSYDIEELKRALDSLPTEFREPFSMHIAGYKYREIAEQLNLPLGVVKSRIFFTRQRLQEVLKDYM